MSHTAQLSFALCISTCAVGQHNNDANKFSMLAPIRDSIIEQTLLFHLMLSHSCETFWNLGQDNLLT